MAAVWERRTAHRWVRSIGEQAGLEVTTGGASRPKTTGKAWVGSARLWSLVLVVGDVGPPLRGAFGD
jgi:hypothetical protein